MAKGNILGLSNEGNYLSATPFQKTCSFLISRRVKKKFFLNGFTVKGIRKEKKVTENSPQTSTNL